MNTRATIITVIIAIGFVATYWLTGFQKIEKLRVEYEAKKLFDFEGSDIKRLTIKTNDADPVEAERIDDTNWHISLPYEHINPNHLLWTQLADKVVPFLINQRTIEASPEDLALYGLEDPSLTIIVETNQMQILQVDIGLTDPTQNNHYAKLPSGEVFLLPAEMANALYRPLSELRDNRVFTKMDTKIDTIQFIQYPVDDPGDGIEPLSGIDETYVIGDDGKWRFVQPVDALASQFQLQRLINQTQFMAAENYIDAPDALSDYGLNPPWAKLSLQSEEGNAKQTLWLGWIDTTSDRGSMFATIEGNPSVFRIDAQLRTGLPQSPQHYRENRLYTGEALNLSSIEYRDNRRSLTLTNTLMDGWQLTEPSYPDTNNLAVSQLITALKTIKGNRFPDDEEIATSFGAGQITYTLNYTNSPSTSITIGNTVPDSIEPVMFYVRQDFGSVTTIPFNYVQYLRSNAFRFRDPYLLRFATGDISELTITLDGDTYTLVQQSGGWTVTQPENHALESSADLLMILEAIRSAYANDVAEPAPSEEVTGLGEPILEIGITESSPDGISISQTLILGNFIASESRDLFGRIAGRPETFYVDHGLIEDLRTGLRGIRPIN